MVLDRTGKREAILTAERWPTGGCYARSVFRNTPGGLGRLRSRRALLRFLALGIAAILVGACSPSDIAPTFSLSIRNAGDAAVRLKVVVGSEGRPSDDLLIPGRSGILQTRPRPMDVKDGKPDPVVIEVYTETCALLTSVMVGEGQTRIVVAKDLSVTTSAGSGDAGDAGATGPGVVEPGLVPGC